MKQGIPCKKRARRLRPSGATQGRPTTGPCQEQQFQHAALLWIATTPCRRNWLFEPLC